MHDAVKCFFGGHVVGGDDILFQGGKRCVVAFDVVIGQLARMLLLMKRFTEFRETPIGSLSILVVEKGVDFGDIFLILP